MSTTPRSWAVRSIVLLSIVLTLLCGAAIGPSGPAQHSLLNKAGIVRTASAATAQSVSPIKKDKIECPKKVMAEQQLFNDPYGSREEQRCINEYVIWMLDHALPGASVDLTSYSLTDDRIAHAVTGAHKRGVNILFSYWKGEKEPDGSYHNYGPTLKILTDDVRNNKKYGATLKIVLCTGACFFKKDHGADHHAKALLINRLKVSGTVYRDVMLIMSGNLSLRAGEGQYNNAQLIKERSRIFGCVHRYVVAATVTHKKDVKSFAPCSEGPYRIDFSPRKASSPILSDLKKLNCRGGGSIGMTNMDFRIEGFAKELYNCKKEGGKVESVVTASAVYKKPMSYLKKAGKVWDCEIWPKDATSSPGMYMHNKIFYMVGKQGKTKVTIYYAGSPNVNKQATGKDGRADEISLRVTGSVAKKYGAEAQIMMKEAKKHSKLLK